MRNIVLIGIPILRRGLLGSHRDLFLKWLYGADIEINVDGKWNLIDPDWTEGCKYRVYDPERWRKDYLAEQTAGQEFERKNSDDIWCTGIWIFLGHKENYRRVENKPVEDKLVEDFITEEVRPPKITILTVKKDPVTGLKTVKTMTIDQLRCKLEVDTLSFIINN